MLLVLSLFLAGIQTPLSMFGGIFFVGLGNGLTMPSAQSGMLSVKPELAGTASGLGGAIMIGGGAVLSAVTGALLGPETGAWPLILMMLGSLCLRLKPGSVRKERFSSGLRATWLATSSNPN